MGLGVEIEVIIQKGKLHMNDWQVACGVSVEPYKFHLKPAHHTPIVCKSPATLKTTALFPTGLLTTWSPAYVLEKVCHVCTQQPQSLGSASPARSPGRAGAGLGKAGKTDGRLARAGHPLASSPSREPQDLEMRLGGSGSTLCLALIPSLLPH